MNRLQQRKLRRKQSTIPDITLTPLIDTALTLLIIFMVTSPVIHNAIKVDLPKGNAQEGGRDLQELIVSIDNKGKIFFNDKLTTIEALGGQIKNAVSTNGNTEKSVWIKIDAGNSCDTLIGVIDRIKVVGGVKDVKVATQRRTA
jgi:biopolymer transport protein ExbD